MKIKSSVFAVHDQPFCLWGFDLSERNAEFLRALDPDYFTYVLEQNAKELDSTDNGLRAATAIRLAYYQSLEMLFSCVGAWLQAPDCIYAWIEKCKTDQLRQVIEDISAGRRQNYSRTSLSKPSWILLAQAVVAHMRVEVERKAALAKGFASAWRQLAHDFLDEHHIAEYNALKHGYRVSPGGFTFSVGIEDHPEVPATAEKMQVMADSKWGTTFFRLARFGGAEKSNRSLRSIRHSLNWSANNTIAATHLIAVSIKNVIAAILVSEGTPASSIQFLVPAEDEFFQAPWKHSIGPMRHATMDLVMDDSVEYGTTKTDLENVFEKQQPSGPV